MSGSEDERAKRKKRDLLYEELRALPPNFVGEIFAGKLRAAPRPAPRHALAASALGGQLMTGFQLGKGGPGGWWILDEPELHLGYDVLVPDIAGWRRERMPGLPETAHFSLAPDWVCEVLSPSTGGEDRVRKLPIYGREGVGHAWIVDPEALSLEVYRQADGAWTLIAGYMDDQKVRAAPFEAFELDLRDLWAPTPTEG